MQAFMQASKMMMAELHMSEQPVAMITQSLANINRDQKKKPKPYKLEEFFLYQPRELRNIPDSKSGSAALKLIALNLFPSWALFCYKELAAAASVPPPALLAYICEDAILLAPEKIGSSVSGMLIAMESASNKKLVLTSPCGDSITVRLPNVHTKVIAQEDVVLQLIN